MTGTRNFTWRLSAVCAALLAIATLSSCGQNQTAKEGDAALAEIQLKPVTQRAAAPPGHPPMGGRAAPATARPGAVDLQGVTAVMPEGWRQLAPSSSMRVAEFELPGSSGPANLAVFAGTMGTVDANVARWVGQFSAADGSATVREERRSLVVGEGEEGGGLQVVRVAVSGTFNGGMGMGGGTSSPGYRMVGAIVQSGSGFHYLKAVGPEATVVEREDEFDAFVGSLRGG